MCLGIEDECPNPTNANNVERMMQHFTSGHGVRTTTNDHVSLGRGEYIPTVTNSNAIIVEDKYLLDTEEDNSEGKFIGDCMVRGEGEEKFIGDCMVQKTTSGGTCDGLTPRATGKNDYMACGDNFLTYYNSTSSIGEGISASTIFKSYSTLILNDDRVNDGAKDSQKPKSKGNVGDKDKWVNDCVSIMEEKDTNFTPTHATPSHLTKLSLPKDMAGFFSSSSTIKSYAFLR
ncbi:hypothetical protein L2E82_30487 [Cichorium intybus]|uniref:Uncharacterized protein n=1 Tax=Cichorium intybus TaxID=13427 RepID=A0ACB9D0I3_CICIN|nr:hypothetical protein L2E82_30487 [Cichorium intybus]